MPPPETTPAASWKPLKNKNDTTKRPTHPASQAEDGADPRDDPDLANNARADQIVYVHDTVLCKPDQEWLAGSRSAGKKVLSVSEQMEIIDRRNQPFTIIDHQIVFDPRLDSYLQSCYLALSVYAGFRDRSCWPSVLTIADRMGCSDRQVQKCLKRLKMFGYIDIVHRKGENRRNMTNLYILLPLPNIHSLVNQVHQDGEPGSPYGEPGSPKQDSYNDIGNDEEEPPALSQEIPSHHRPAAADLQAHVRKHIGKPFPPAAAEKLASWRKFFPDEMIRYAIEIAGERGGKSYSYVKKILEQWQKAGACTLEAAQIEVAKHEAAAERRKRAKPTVPGIKPNLTNEFITGSGLDDYSELIANK